MKARGAALTYILFACLFGGVTSQRRLVEVGSQSATGCRLLCLSHGENCSLAHFRTSVGLCYIYSHARPVLPGLPDSAITALTTHFGQSEHGHARLQDTDTPGCWCSKNNVNGDYLQLDMQKNRTLVKIATQGRGDGQAVQYVRRYKLRYSVDGTTWAYYTDQGGVVKEFTGNVDVHTVVENEFAFPITARFVRLYPTSYQLWKCVRWELYEW